MRTVRSAGVGPGLEAAVEGCARGAVRRTGSDGRRWSRSPSAPWPKVTRRSARIARQGRVNVA